MALLKRLFLSIFFITVLGLSTHALASASQKETEARRLSLIWDKFSIDHSTSLFSEAANEWEKMGELRKASDCLRESAYLLMLSSEYQIAFNQLQTTLKIDRKTDYIDGQIISLSLISRMKNQEGKIDESKEYYKKALKLIDSSSSSTAKANAFFSAAEFNLFFGNIKETINLYEKALFFAEKADDQKLSAQILINLGYSYLRDGNVIIGLQKQKDSLAIVEKIADKRGQAIALNGVGSLYVFMGEKRKALDIFLKAESMYPKDFDWLEKGKLFNGIATIYEDYGEYKLAGKYRQSAYDVFGKAKYPYGQLATLPVLARHQYLKGDALSGENLYIRGLDMAKELKSDFHIGIIKEDIGKIYFESNDYKNAIKNYQEAIKIYQKLKIELPRINTLLGQAYLKSSNFILANEYFHYALAKNKQTKDLSPASENLYYLAKLNQIESKHNEALKYIIESINITESLYVDATNSKLKSTYFSNVFDRYELYINLLMKMQKQSPDKDFAIQALQAVEKSRSRSMMETLTLSEANFTKDANPETVKREKEIRSLLNLKSDKLTDLLSQNTDQAEIAKVDDEINELEHELEDIKANLKQNSPLYSAIKNPEPFDVKDFQDKILDENSLLLEFSLGETESYLWLVGKNEVSSYILPSRAEIESKVKTLRELIAARVRQNNETIEDYQARIAKTDFEYPETARQLSNELFGQIAEKLSNKRLIIVPDGKLHYFPVSALPLPNSTDNTPILVSNEVIYEPSASTLMLIAKTENQTKAAAKNLLVFSDPVFSEDDSRFVNNTETTQNINRENKLRFAESLNSLPRLTESKDEGDSIVNIAGAYKTDIFTGFAATRQHFLDANISDYKVLHLATHGLIDENRPELSGIIFSRFNEKHEKLDEVVRLQDIYGLKLNADLVVLSACETGIGKEEKGEGLLSLNNGFLQVGAKTVLSSLWKVEDSATVELMKNFYEIMASENITSSKALQKAQIKMWESGRYKSPFYWAAFIVQGDFRRKPNISNGSSASFLIAGLSLFILVSGFSIFYFPGRRKN